MNVHSNTGLPPLAPATARRVRAIWLVSTVAIALLIAVTTLMPSPHMPHSGYHLDKLAHMAAFFVLVFPTAALWPRVTAWIGLLAVLYGGAIEVIQPYTGRSAELGDLLADGIGVALGIIVGTTLRRIIVAHRMARA